jgi:hypothetical protein
VTGVRVEAVREVVSDDAYRYGHRQGGVRPVGDAVQEAVDDEGRAGCEADARPGVSVGGVVGLVGVVHAHRAFHDVDAEEGQGEREHGQGYAVHAQRFEGQGLREEVEGDHAEHDAGREAEDEVAASADAVGDEAAEQRHHEGGQRQQDRHEVAG